MRLNIVAILSLILLNITNLFSEINEVLPSLDSWIMMKETMNNTSKEFTYEYEKGTGSDSVINLINDWYFAG